MWLEAARGSLLPPLQRRQPCPCAKARALAEHVQVGSALLPPFV